jgi:hypothetical protein
MTLRHPTEKPGGFVHRGRELRMRWLRMLRRRRGQQRRRILRRIHVIRSIRVPGIRRLRRVIHVTHIQGLTLVHLSAQRKRFSWD